MNQTEMLKKLSGGLEDKKFLFEYLLNKAVTVGLADDEKSMMEYLKEFLFSSKNIEGINGV